MHIICAVVHSPEPSSSCAGLNFGALITSLYGAGLLLGTVYSVPPFHLKRFPVPAFLIIATVRGFLLNFGVYFATRAALGLPQFQWSPAIRCARAAHSPCTGPKHLKSC